jgi:hypothetical protein
MRPCRHDDLVEVSRRRTALELDAPLAAFFFPNQARNGRVELEVIPEIKVIDVALDILLKRLG